MHQNTFHVLPRSDNPNGNVAHQDLDNTRLTHPMHQTSIPHSTSFESLAPQPPTKSTEPDRALLLSPQISLELDDESARRSPQSVHAPALLTNPTGRYVVHHIEEDEEGVGYIFGVREDAVGDGAAKPKLLRSYRVREPASGTFRQEYLGNMAAYGITSADGITEEHSEEVDLEDLEETRINVLDADNSVEADVADDHYHTVDIVEPEAAHDVEPVFVKGEVDDDELTVEAEAARDEEPIVKEESLSYQARSAPTDLVDAEFLEDPITEPAQFYSTPKVDPHIVAQRIAEMKLRKKERRQKKKTSGRKPPLKRQVISATSAIPIPPMEEQESVENDPSYEYSTSTGDLTVGQFDVAPVGDEQFADILDDEPQLEDVVENSSFPLAAEAAFEETIVDDPIEDATVDEQIKAAVDEHIETETTDNTSRTLSNADAPVTDDFDNFMDKAIDDSIDRSAPDDALDSETEEVTTDILDLANASNAAEVSDSLHGNNFCTRKLIEGETRVLKVNVLIDNLAMILSESPFERKLKTAQGQKEHKKIAQKFRKKVLPKAYAVQRELVQSDIWLRATMAVIRNLSTSMTVMMPHTNIGECVLAEFLVIAGKLQAAIGRYTELCDELAKDEVMRKALAESIRPK